MRDYLRPLPFSLHHRHRHPRATNTASSADKQKLVRNPEADVRRDTFVADAPTFDVPW